MFRAVTVHLDAHCSRAHRRRQMQDHSGSPRHAVAASDSDRRRLEHDHVQFAEFDAGDHGLLAAGFYGPEKRCEEPLAPSRTLFRTAALPRSRRSRFQLQRSLNEIGVGTLHYHVESIEKNTNLRDWVPEWCFPFIFWAAGRVGGTVSGRLDWFAGKGIRLAHGAKPETFGDLTDHEATAAFGSRPDHCRGCHRYETQNEPLLCLRGCVVVNFRRRI